MLSALFWIKFKFHKQNFKVWDKTQFSPLWEKRVCSLNSARTRRWRATCTPITSSLWWPPLSDRVELDKVVWLPITGDPFDLPLWETFKSPVVCFDRGKNAVSREVMLNSATLHKDVPIQTQHTSTYRCFPIKHKIFNRLVSESLPVSGIRAAQWDAMRENQPPIFAFSARLRKQTVIPKKKNR